VDGHGDLRPEHIYLLPQPTVIDCIEFNPEMRQIDVLDDLCFLAVECDYLGARSVGGQILDAYCRSSGDQPPVGLLPFYSSYRACVRAKVSSLRAGQISGSLSASMHEAAVKYLDLAGQYASELGPSRLFVVCGRSGVGKSTVAQGLAESLGLEILQTDRIRRTMYGPSERPAAYDSQHYAPEMRNAVYAEMFRQAGQLLSNGLSVVLDGTFLAARQRTRAASLARRHDAESYFVRCECSDEVAIDRLAARPSDESLSEVRPEFLQRQRDQQEPDPPGISVCTVDSTESIPAMLRRIYRWLREPRANRSQQVGPK
jgi:predicted kinase